MRSPISDARTSTRAELWALTFAVCFPSVLTWVYFVALAAAPSAIQQGVYGVGKVLQFLFPILFVLLLRGEPIGLPLAWRPRISEAITSGLLITASIAVVWQVLLRTGSPLLEDLVPNVSAKIVGFGVASPLRYLVLALFYSVIHTFLEEYYWRWFVFSRLRRHTTRSVGIALSSLGFMAHHVIVMGVYAGWTSPYTYLFSGAVALGGAYWAWLYDRSDSLVAPWVSHVFVDMAIFAIGYSLL